MRNVRSVGIACLAITLGLPAFGHTLSNSRITVKFDTSGSTTADRLDSLVWIKSNGVATSNLAVSGGTVCGGDPIEFFGQSYGDVYVSQMSPPLFIVQGASATWVKNSSSSGTSTTTGSDSGSCATLDGTAETNYSLGSGSNYVNTIKITRAFTFNDDQDYNLRAYVPRVSVNAYYETIYPDSTGTLQTIELGDTYGNCPYGCEISDWAGTWIADDDGSGNGIMLIRQPTFAVPAEIDVDYDDYSLSNSSAIVLMRPEAGWSGTVTETEYLCIYDATSWPIANRATSLPAGCQVPLTGHSPKHRR
jgi:hypothetical protein